MIPATLRRALALAVVAILLATGAVTAESRAVTAVTWVTDHAAKTITATVRLRLGSACTRGQMARATTQGPAAAKRCKVGLEIAKAIKDNVDAVWNKDLTYFCYKVKVVMDIDLAEELTGAKAGSEATPGDRHYVAIDQSPADIRSFVSLHRFETATWDGYTATDANLPANGGERPSAWKYPQTWEQSLYAHEVAHVMSLSDHDEDVRDANGQLTSQPRQGAPVDVMSSVVVTNVDQSTVNRLVARAGVDPYTLMCDWTVEGPIAGGRMTGTKCGGIAGEWRIETDLKQGPASVQQTWRFTADAEGQGDFTYTDHALTKVPQSLAEGWGTASGTGDADLPWDGTVVMTLKETRHRAKGRGTAGGRTITSPEADVPLVDYEFVWKPTVCRS